MVDTKRKKNGRRKKRERDSKMIRKILDGGHDICLKTYIFNECLGNNDI